MTLHWHVQKKHFFKHTRCTLKAWTWRHALDAGPSNIDSCENGWCSVMVPVLAPPEVLNTRTCYCAIVHQSSTQHARLPCTLFCTCRQENTDQCYNMHDFHVHCFALVDRRILTNVTTCTTSMRTVLYLSTGEYWPMLQWTHSNVC